MGPEVPSVLSLMLFCYNGGFLFVQSARQERLRSVTTVFFLEGMVLSVFLFFFSFLFSQEHWQPKPSVRGLPETDVVLGSLHRIAVTRPMPLCWAPSVFYPTWGSCSRVVPSSIWHARHIHIADRCTTSCLEPCFATLVCSQTASVASQPSSGKGCVVNP